MNACVPATAVCSCFSKAQLTACPMYTFISKGELQKSQEQGCDLGWTMPFP